MSADSPEDKAALAALLTKYERMWWERERDKKLKEAVDARMAQYPPMIANLRAAFALFGVEGLATSDWEKLRERLGEDIYTAARLKAPRNPPAPEIPQEVEIEDDDEEEGWLIAPDDNSELPEAESEKNRGDTVREIVIEKLKEAGKTGTKAADLRRYIEAVRGTPLHEKTVGMTLYRLSTDGLARREGRTWFFVESSDETKNPGGDTPGLINRDTKEGEEP